MIRKNRQVYSMAITAMLLGLGMLVPYLTGRVPEIGKFFSPIHIPVLICALTCGWKWALGLGIALPLINSALFQMPPFPAKAVPMVFELAAYGLAGGLIYAAFLRRRGHENHWPYLVIALFCAMVIGRVVGGAAKGALFTFLLPDQKSYTVSTFFSMLFADYFVGTAVGAAIHLLLIPPVVMALEKAKLSPLALEYR
ncbi:MAG: ECF transporter S component [Clostridiales bacterium]|nr:ECF transporter S component [Clostridiales bacterium]